MDRDDGVPAIVLTAEHLLDLAALDQASEMLEAVSQLAGDIFALRGPIDQHADVVGFALERRNQLDFFFDPPPALKGLLRFDLVVPEVRLRGTGFYLGELVARACGLKDNSGDRRPASRGPDTGGISHRVR
jgi:hypothetical protein